MHADFPFCHLSSISFVILLLMVCPHGGGRLSFPSDSAAADEQKTQS